MCVHGKKRWCDVWFTNRGMKKIELESHTQSQTSSLDKLLSCINRWWHNMRTYLVRNPSTSCIVPHTRHWYTAFDLDTICAFIDHLFFTPTIAKNVFWMNSTVSLGLANEISSFQPTVCIRACIWSRVRPSKRSRSVFILNTNAGHGPWCIGKSIRIIP